MKNLRELRGQKTASALLQGYLQGPLPPLLIFYGPDGTGKWSAAEAFIQQRFCEVGTGCGNCAPCRKLARGDHADLIQFPEEKILIGEPDKPAEFTIRWLVRTRLRYAPFDGPLRFVVFPRSELIQHEAETALLKTLEEPPEHTRFIFLVRSLDDVKATVVSRGICIPFGLLPASDMQVLAGFPPEQNELLGGSLHLAPFFQTELCKALGARMERMFEHPQGLLDMETWLLQSEKKGAPEAQNDEDQYEYLELLDIFGLLLLQRAARHEAGSVVRRAVFELKGELHREMAGMNRYLLSRFFQRLALALYPHAFGN